MPHQIPLFGQLGEGVLAEDRRGRITYAPGFVPADVARAWFDELRGAVPWESQRRWMYEREVDVPRLNGALPADHLDEIVQGHPIALLSLGAMRRMIIRAQRAPRHVLHVDLDHRAHGASTCGNGSLVWTLSRATAAALARTTCQETDGTAACRGGLAPCVSGGVHWERFASHPSLELPTSSIYLRS